MTRFIYLALLFYCALLRDIMTLDVQAQDEQDILEYNPKEVSGENEQMRLGFTFYDFVSEESGAENTQWSRQSLQRALCLEPAELITKEITLSENEPLEVIFTRVNTDHQFGEVMRRKINML